MSVRALRISPCWDVNKQGGMCSIQLSCKQSIIRTHILIKKKLLCGSIEHLILKSVVHTIFFWRKSLKSLKHCDTRLLYVYFSTQGAQEKIRKRWQSYLCVYERMLRSFSPRTCQVRKGMEPAPCSICTGGSGDCRSAGGLVPIYSSTGSVMSWVWFCTPRKRELLSWS